MPRTGTTRRAIWATTLRDGAETASSVVSRLDQSASYALRRLPRWRPFLPPSRPRDLFRGSLGLQGPTVHFHAVAGTDPALNPAVRAGAHNAALEIRTMLERSLAVFDFDHTITSWDTAGRFFMWLIRRSPIKVITVAAAVPLLGPFFALRRTRRIPLRFGAWVATFGFEVEGLRLLAQRHIRDVIDRGESFVGSDARGRISHHLSLGHEVVVATGSLEVLAREILRAEGVENVEVVGSTVRRYLGGMVVVQHCYGERKVAMLEQRGFGSQWAFAYSDHEADLPLLQRARQRVIVNPKSRSESALLSALGTNAHVVKWR